MASTVANLDGRTEARAVAGELIPRIIEMIKSWWTCVFSKLTGRISGGSWALFLQILLYSFQVSGTTVAGTVAGILGLCRRSSIIVVFVFSVVLLWLVLGLILMVVPGLVLWLVNSYAE